MIVVQVINVKKILSRLSFYTTKKKDAFDEQFDKCNGQVEQLKIQSVLLLLSINCI